MNQKMCKLYSSFNAGIVGIETEIEISISPGLPSFDIIGLCDSSIRESRGRIKSAIISSGYKMPPGHIVVNISPAYVKKSGSTFDLPIALGIIMATSQCDYDKTLKIYSEGELSLGGEVKACPGGAIRLMSINKDVFDRIIIPKDERLDMSCADIHGKCCKTLSEAVNLISGIYEPDVPEKLLSETESEFLDFSCLKGQFKASQALLIAASGWHSILMLGSPGSGKTLAGRLISGILPPLDDSELREVFAIQESCGLITSSEDIKRSRPFRYIRNTDSISKMIGSSVKLCPGELALSNHGVLFVDELCEFPSGVLDLLRQPLEERRIVLSRDGTNYVFPSDFLFVGAGNPCRCGNYYEGKTKCSCTARIRKQYRSRISGPLLDRIDLFTEMKKIDDKYLPETLNLSNNKMSDEMKKRVSDCWLIQRERYKWTDKKIFNSNVESENLADLFRAGNDVIEQCTKAASVCGYSVRGFNKLLRIGRTIADLDQRKDMCKDDIREALTYRYRVED